MKNIEKFNVSVLDTNEMKFINEGGLFRDLGRMAGKAWYKVKEFVADMDNHLALGHVTGSHA
ncbi:hypothetical protein J8L85_13445 [Maribacter sp. MMG018]|uniref:hypothetical protein n=1 Tax=Maribacter sp. MMG018 TaxID=2822688 RepID=UPI001B36D1F5|nr:hypothetical protein [Maribacter sp. MMG018]MBQ4915453.1 hypothetical protein [Maribacter sp. MMG018]